MTGFASEDGGVQDTIPDNRVNRPGEHHEI
jgi:hypothetical protein